jgi:ABC-type transport system involved in multi-copper enzyme maturation permease subunit
MPHRPSLFGTFARWELLRLIRRKQARAAPVLLLYLLLLTLGMFAVWWSAPASPLRLVHGTGEPLSLGHGGDDRRSAAYFAESLALVLFEAQLFFVAVLTPAYTAAAIAEEKDSQSLTLLLTTELTDTVIVWGKSLARVVLMLASVAAAIPVMLLVLLYGGVPWELIAAGYLLIVGTTILTAAMGMNAGCGSADTRTALVRALSQVTLLVGGLPLFMKLSPFAILAYEFGVEGPGHLKLEGTWLRLAVGAAYALLQSLLGIVLLLRATSRLRTHEPGAGPPSLTAYPEPPKGRLAPLVLAPSPVPARERPPLDPANPVLWKERHSAGGQSLPLYDLAARGLKMVLTLLATSLFIVGGWLLLHSAISGMNPDESQAAGPADWQRPASGSWFLMAGVLASSLFLIPVSIGISGCVAGERHRQTLDSLLMTAQPRRTILWSKVRAQIEAWLVIGVGAVTAIGCAFAAEGGIECGFVAMAALVAGFWVACAWGAWFSVRCAHSWHAFRVTLPVVIGSIAWLPLTWLVIDWNHVESATMAMLWIAAALILAGCTCWWRAVAELSRGECWG